ncbi:transcription factor-like 5 protein [Limulus polyphemus]|uniref:Transcription factor-like 5 protein n=1 Tax=Limulus polyphemus TaxID=6850 RepID=A0ABM1SUP3_LIMPO|nr:transcription factor-like 5 protein [Limulus polyphemus]
MRLASTGQFQQIIGSLESVPLFLPLNGRENHNEKERKRRGRIKNACQGLRSLVPGLSEKTDKATVFEFTVQYLVHLKKHIGIQYDKDFIEKYLQY